MLALSVSYRSRPFYSLNSWVDSNFKKPWNTTGLRLRSVWQPPVIATIPAKAGISENCGYPKIENPSNPHSSFANRQSPIANRHSSFLTLTSKNVNPQNTRNFYLKGQHLSIKSSATFQWKFSVFQSKDQHLLSIIKKIQGFYAC